MHNVFGIRESHVYIMKVIGKGTENVETGIGSSSGHVCSSVGYLSTDTLSASKLPYLRNTY